MTAALTIVTGADGWLGSSLMAALADRPEVRVLDGDVRDATAVDRLFVGAEGATVFHLAGLIHPPSGRTRELYDVNVGGTAIVVERARRAGVRRVVFVSSDSPFGPSRPGRPHDEQSPYNPTGAYGTSKMEAERIVLGRGGVVLRPPWFYGPHQPERQTQFLKMARRGLFPLCGGGQNLRPIVYTGNLVHALLQAAQVDGIQGRAFWIADAAHHRLADIVEAARLACAQAGLTTSKQRVNLPHAAAAAARMADAALQSIGLYNAQAHVAGEIHEEVVCSIDAARSDLGYDPKVELQEGMRRSVEWCLEQGYSL